MRIILHIFLIVVSVSVFAVRADEVVSESRQETVFVTGSYTGSAERVGLPLDVLDRQDLRRSGYPWLHDLSRALSAGGVDGQSNQYASGWLSGTANVNLRALGAGRNLILLNGRRLSLAPFAIDEQAQAFTDIRQLPSSSSLSSLEVLRHGAASMYGSDAVSGVVNFSTRGQMEGLEFSSRYSGISGSSGDISVSVQGGRDVLGFAVFAVVSADFRSELPVRARDWALRPYSENGYGGWSSIGNPGSFKSAEGSWVADEHCAALGGAEDGSFCRFRYGEFSNLLEESRHWNVFIEAEREIFEGVDFRSEFLFSDTDLPSYDTSPSLPPRVLLGQVVPSDHPALESYREDNPDWSSEVYGGSDPAVTDLLYYGRAFGVGGNPLTSGGGATGVRRHRNWRLLAEFSGHFAGSFEWEAALGWSGAHSRRTAWDIYRAGFGNALRGYGLCSDAVTGEIYRDDTGEQFRAGEGGCEYYNPFSSAIERSVVTGEINPGYDSELANSPELAEWLFGELHLDGYTGLLELDTRVQWEGLDVEGGEVNFAAGFQYRRDSYAMRPDEISDLEQHPGETGAGVYSFLAGSYEQSRSRDVYALYGELRLQPQKLLEVQMAVRLEGQGEQFISLVPKLSSSWRIAPFLSMHAGIQTSFRAPTLNQLGGRTSSLQYVAPTGSFKLVELHGDADLRPERSFEVNAGLVFEEGEFRASFEYWRLSLSETLFVESYQEIVEASKQALEAGEMDALILDRVVFADMSLPRAAEISSIRTNIINGPLVVASGLSMRLDWRREDLWGGEANFGVEAEYMLGFHAGSYLIEDASVSGGDFSGQFNRSNSFRSHPRWKGRVLGGYSKGRYYLSGVVNMVGGYRDERSGAASIYEVQGLRGISSWVTLDCHYLLEVSDTLEVGLDMENIFDSAPPFVAFDVNYDPYTHTPSGRIFKASLLWRY